MNKRLNTTHVSLSALVMTCVMAVMLLCGCLTLNVKAATQPGFSITKAMDGSMEVRLADVQNTDIVNATINLLTSVDVTVENSAEVYTINSGIYHFDANGRLSLSGIENAGVAKMESIADMSSTFVTTAPANKMVKNGPVAIVAPTTDENGLAVNGTISSGIELFTGLSNNTVYSKGVAYTGYLLQEDLLYKVTDGNLANKELVNGLAKGSYMDAATWTVKNFSANGFYVKKGAKFTGLVGLKYYTNGNLATSLTGWKKLDKKIYYFSKGVAVTGWKRLSSYGKGTKKYKYLFNDKGVLYTDLINYYGYNNFIKKDIKIVTNKNLNNTTFYLKDEKGEYTVPAKTIICATARKKGDTPNGTHHLEKTSAKRWFIYKKTEGAPWRYYQWAVHIKGTPVLIHSSAYTKQSAKALNVSYYNKLGTKCTTHCIRFQAKYAKMVYDIATKTNKKRRVWVQVMESKNAGPFGKYTLADFGGKVKKGTKWDPTDPNKK